MILDTHVGPAARIGKGLHRSQGSCGRAKGSIGTPHGEVAIEATTGPTWSKKGRKRSLSECGAEFDANTKQPGSATSTPVHWAMMRFRTGVPKICYFGM